MIPSLLAVGEAEAAVRSLAIDLDGLDSGAAVEDVLKRIAATTACHAAVKANDRLTQEKMLHILSELRRTEYSTVCPHGRPVVLRSDEAGDRAPLRAYLDARSARASESGSRRRAPPPSLRRGLPQCREKRLRAAGVPRPPPPAEPEPWLGLACRAVSKRRSESRSSHSDGGFAPKPSAGFFRAPGGAPHPRRRSAKGTHSVPRAAPERGDGVPARVLKRGVAGRSPPSKMRTVGVPGDRTRSASGEARGARLAPEPRRFRDVIRSPKLRSPEA